MQRMAAIALALVGSLAACDGARANAAGAAPKELAENAFEAAQWVMASAAARAVAQVAARAAAGSPELKTMLRARQDAEALHKASEAAYAEAVGTDAEAAKRRQGETKALAERITLIDRDLSVRFPKFQELAHPRPLSAKAVQSLLQPDEALVLFLASRRATYVWTVSRAGIAWHKSALGQEDLAQRVSALRVSLDPSHPSRSAEALDDGAGAGNAGRIAPFDRQTAFALYQDLLEPVEAGFRGAKTVFVVADGPLTSLPLSLLVTRPPDGEDGDPEALRRTAWLLGDHAITMLPAVTSLAALRAPAGAVETSPRRPFVGFGAPTLEGRRAVSVADAGTEAGAADELATRGMSAFFDGALADVDAVRSLSPLPGTAKELRRMAGVFGTGVASIHLGAEASERAVRAADLSDVSVLAFATHGLVSGELRGLAEPALVFTPPAEASAENDGLLTASEVAGLRLSADWIILSACNTAAGDGTPGAEALSGLARAFLYAGARAILVSHWPVRDDAAGVLTASTLAFMREDPTLGRAEALRKASLHLMNDISDPTLAHPSAWAPFVVVGDGGALR